MGNDYSIDIMKDKNKTFSQTLDFIATEYILSMDFESLTKLYNKNYCDNLIILTSDIIQKYFTDLEIEYLFQRTKNGIEENIHKNEDVIFIFKNKLNNYDNELGYKKKRICIGIAKFYIQIAHVFAAIITTINPVYVYKDNYGNEIKKSLYEKATIPKNVDRKLHKFGICNTRIDSLSFKDDNIIEPNVCNKNINKMGNIKTLNEEPGINELMSLYYDEYDFYKGEFTGMTQQTYKQYKADLENVYKTFTGKDHMPENIKKFSDIKLRDYNKLDGCNTIGILKTRVKKTVNENSDVVNLFNKYANNLKMMMKKTEKTQDVLLEIINSLFTYNINNSEDTHKNKVIIVNPKLTQNELQKIIKHTRNVILDLYLNCENDYVEGIKIYQAIVEKKIKDTTINQIKELEKFSLNVKNNDLSYKVYDFSDINEKKENQEKEYKRIEEPKNEKKYLFNFDKYNKYDKYNK